MTMSLAPVIGQQFFDVNGNPLSGGKLYSYQAGTSTPQATYVDSGVTPNANPVILDSGGGASVWLDPSLSYKFILQDSNGVVQRTVDGVIGLLTNNSVVTASIQDGAVTTAKIADDAVTAVKLRDDASVDANRAVTTDHIRDSAITTAKILDSAVTRAKIDSSVLSIPSSQRLTSGSGTYGLSYYFIVTSANATVGATYTNNGKTFTVTATIASGLKLLCTSTGAPTASGTLTKSAGSGDATIAFSTYQAPSYIKVRQVGGGGGGSGGNGNTGSAGGTTTFGSSLLTCTGGGGAGANTGSGAQGGTGGTITVNSPAVTLINFIGGTGSGSGFTGSWDTTGAGAASPFGGAGGGSVQNASANATYTNAVPNTGSGGGGGGYQSYAGGGGGAGGYIEARISSPSATYSYAVGASGTSTGGGAGGSGLIVVEEYFQ